MAHVELTRTTPEVSMWSLAIVALIFFSALIAETMWEPTRISATSVRATQETDARKKKQATKEKKSNQQKQARQRNETLPPNLGPGIGLGL